MLSCKYFSITSNSKAASFTVCQLISNFLLYS
nr:MAG TPA: hypothetical protein [Caudoviricetes sp.]